MKFESKQTFVMQTKDKKLHSYAINETYDVDDEIAEQLKEDGIADEPTEFAPEGTIEITTNGTVDVKYYAEASVNVEGISPTGTKTITENGTYDVTNFASAEVNVSGGGTTPTGTKSITANGTYDVTDFASAEVNVSLFTVSYDPNGATGFAQNQSVIAGGTIATLDDGSDLIAPSSKHTFLGWATTSDASTPNVVAPYTPQANITLYAVWQAPQTFTITLHDGATWKISTLGYTNPAIVEAGQEYQCLPTNSTLGGQDGWSTTFNGPVVYNFGDKFIPTDDMDLYLVPSRAE